MNNGHTPTENCGAGSADHGFPDSHGHRGIIYPSPIFGPVRSRRLGLSLGINLMPADGKICTFDCVYCECGFNADHRPRLHRPTREEVKEALEAQLRRMADEGELPDVLTFAGNGEPTAHPDFAGIIDDTIGLRDRNCPAARVSVLSNATRCRVPDVYAALLRVDNNIQKLDTANAGYIARIDRPKGGYDVDETINALAAFDGHVIVQTLFIKGTSGGFNADNTTDDYVSPWLDALRCIRPSRVMIYTIDRATPDENLRKATPEELDRIAARVRAAGFEADVAY